MASSTFALRSARPAPAARNRSPIRSPIVSHGVREDPASWKIICGAESPTSKRPPVTGISPAAARMKVVLPDPLSPTSATASPWATVRLTPSRMRIGSWRRSHALRCHRDLEIHRAERRQILGGRGGSFPCDAAVGFLEEVDLRRAETRVSVQARP